MPSRANRAETPNPNQLLRAMVEKGASDMHITAGAPPLLRIDGEIQGDFTAEPEAGSLVVISEKARVHGKVKAAHVIINGSVCGPVTSTEMLELQPKASVVGDVQYEVLEMHPGATIDGELKPLKATERPALTLAAANDA